MNKETVSFLHILLESAEGRARAVWSEAAQVVPCVVALGMVRDQCVLWFCVVGAGAWQRRPVTDQKRCLNR